jgi:hypothetical protein
MAQNRADIEDPLGIYDVIAAYCQAYDSQDSEELEKVFSPEATLRMLEGGSASDEAVGRDSVLAWLMRRWGSSPPCLHLTGNLRITPAGDDAKGTSDFVFLVKKEDGSLQMSSSGRYLDRYTRHDGRWVIAERTITFLGGRV